MHIFIYFIFFFFRWLPELNGLIIDLRDKLANRQKPRKSKLATGTQQRLKIVLFIIIWKHRFKGAELSAALLNNAFLNL